MKILEKQNLSFRRNEDSPNDYESSPNAYQSEEEHPSTQWSSSPNVIVCPPYAEPQVKQLDDNATSHPFGRRR